MNAQEVFLGSLSVMLLFSVVVMFMSPENIWEFTIDAVAGTFIGLILIAGVLTGINVLGSGLNSESVAIIFGVGALLNILFQIEIAGFPIGLGLVNNMVNSFGASDGLGLGYLLSTVIGLITLVSGTIIIIEG